jgi:hypothetical protein
MTAVSVNAIAERRELVEPLLWPSQWYMNLTNLD